jgi:hypothetical protein
MKAELFAIHILPKHAHDRLIFADFTQALFLNLIVEY